MTKLIGITQRVSEIKVYSEKRDCLDQQWSLFFEKVGILPVSIPNLISSPSSFFDSLKLEGLILTGGNDLSFVENPSEISIERDKIENNLLDLAKQKQFPVIGVCRGLQLMNTYLGGKLSKIDNHVSVSHPVNKLRNSDFISRKKVNSYHKWAIHLSDLAEDLIPLAEAPDGSIESFRHKTLPWLAIMWHPERNQPFAEEDMSLFAKHFKTGVEF